MRLITDVKLERKTAVEFEFNGTVEEFMSLPDDQRRDHFIDALKADIESQGGLDIDDFLIDDNNVAYAGSKWAVGIMYEVGLNLLFEVWLPFGSRERLDRWLAEQHLNLANYIIQVVQQQCRVTLPAGYPNIFVQYADRS